MKENQGTPRPHQIVTIPCLIAKSNQFKHYMRSPFISIIWYLWNSTMRAGHRAGAREKRFELLHKRRILLIV